MAKPKSLKSLEKEYSRVVNILKQVVPPFNGDESDPDWIALIKQLAGKYMDPADVERVAPASPPAEPWKQKLSTITPAAPKAPAPSTRVLGVQGSSVPKPRSKWSGGRKVGGPFGAASGPNPPVRSADIDITPDPNIEHEPDPIPPGMEPRLEPDFTQPGMGQMPAQFSRSPRAIATHKPTGMKPQHGGPPVGSDLSKAPAEVPNVTPEDVDWDSLPKDVQREIIRRMRLQMIRAAGGKGGKRKIFGPDMSGPQFDPKTGEPIADPYSGQISPRSAGERQVLKNEADKLKRFVEKWGDYATDKVSAVGPRSAKSAIDPKSVTITRGGKEYSYQGTGSRLTRTGGDLKRNKERTIALLDRLPYLPQDKVQLAHNIIYNFIAAALKGARTEMRHQAYEYLVDQGVIDASKGRGLKFDPRSGEITYFANKEDAERSRAFEETLSKISQELEHDKNEALSTNRLWAVITGSLKAQSGKSGGADVKTLGHEKPEFDVDTGEFKEPDEDEKKRGAKVFTGPNAPIKDPGAPTGPAIDPDTGEEIVGKRSAPGVLKGPEAARAMQHRARTMAGTSQVSPELQGIEPSDPEKSRERGPRRVYARDPQTRITDPTLRGQVMPATRAAGGSLPTPRPQEPRSPGGYIIRKKKPVKDWFERIAEQASGDFTPTWLDDL